MLQAQYPLKSTPRCAQRQIKLAFYNILRRRIVTVLKEWGKLLWKFSEIHDTAESWTTAIAVFLILTLTMDKVLSSAYYFTEGRIAFHDHEARAEQATFQQLVILMERELFERCKEIFHWKFKTRKGGIIACNPIRDGIAAFRRNPPDQRSTNLVFGLRMLIEDFGTYSSVAKGNRCIDLTKSEPQIRAHRTQATQDKGTEKSQYTDAGRLSCIFLDDFLNQ